MMTAVKKFVDHVKSDPPAQEKDVFSFQFKKLHSGPFSGLWELKETTGGKESLLFDANTLGECVGRIGVEFELRGY